MIISSLKLQGFKNYENESFQFHPKINCLVGLNGMGKTNVLDAIHYLAFTKSAFQSSDAQNITHGGAFFAVHGSFTASESLDVSCYQEVNKRKVIKVNRSELSKVGEHIGLIPLILNTPYDSSLIQESSETRRRFLDATLSQFDRVFLEDILKYKRILRQRNSFLKNTADLNTGTASTLLDVYDEDIITLSRRISEKRKALVTQFNPFFLKSYQAIGGENEHIQAAFVSEALDDNFEKRYRSNRKKDILSRRTTLGCHRDEIDFILNDHSVKKIGSQGQQKCFILALRLAQYDYIKEQVETNPILLLDDLFDKLDDVRIQKLVEMLSDSNRFNQVIITDARAERIKSLFDHTSEVKFFEIRNGKIVTDG